MGDDKLAKIQTKFAADEAVILSVDMGGIDLASRLTSASLLLNLRNCFHLLA